jgi:RNA polymerase sigma factor (sigma-70 family)
MEIEALIDVADDTDNLAGRTIAGGDAGQWRLLLDELIPKLYGMFMGRWPNPALAEELVQKTVFDAVRGRQGYDPAKGAPQDWIFGIAFNNIRIEIRRRASRPAVDVNAAMYLQALDTKLLPDEVLEQKETAELVRRALEALPDKEREVLKARYLEGLSIEEMAGRMGTTRKAVYSLLYRAGISFRQRLLKEMPQSQY